MPVAALPTPGVRRCPRCGYRGEGVPYFKRPSHVGLLAGVSLFTYGIGGLVYWLARRGHRVCPSCGLGWEHASASSAAALASGHDTTARAGKSPEPLPASGIGRRVLGVLIALAGVLAIVLGIVNFAPEAIAVGTVIGGAGSLAFWWGHSALQERRRAIMVGLQRQVLLLAEERGGSLTVSEVAARLSLSIPAAEKIMNSMEDGLRVRSDVTEDGLILYEFPELRPRRQLDAGSATT